MRHNQSVKRFIQTCLNARIIVAEIGGTVGFAFLIAFAIYAAWQDFIVKMFR
jgi:hypothetical protein